jgi:hypothetical protein
LANAEGSLDRVLQAPLADRAILHVAGHRCVVRPGGSFIRSARHKNGSFPRQESCEQRTTPRGRWTCARRGQSQIGVYVPNLSACEPRMVNDKRRCHSLSGVRSDAACTSGRIVRHSYNAGPKRRSGRPGAGGRQVPFFFGRGIRVRTCETEYLRVLWMLRSWKRRQVCPPE